MSAVKSYSIMILMVYNSSHNKLSSCELSRLPRGSLCALVMLLGQGSRQWYSIWYLKKLFSIPASVSVLHEFY